MFKKSLIIIFIFFSFFIFLSIAFSAFTPIPVEQQQAIYNNLTTDQKSSLQKKFELTPAQLEANLSDGKKGKITKAAQKMSDANDKTDISKPSFEISVNNISPGNKNLVKGTAKETAQGVLGTIINNLMVAFGVLALLVMTIGGGYMIMYHGQDELLSKGKSIFNSGLIALVVALSAGIIVKLVAYLLYGN